MRVNVLKRLETTSKMEPKIEIVEELGEEKAPGYNGLLNLVKQNNVFYCYFPGEGIQFTEGKTPEKAIENFFTAIVEEQGTQGSIFYFDNFDFYNGKYSSKLEDLFYKKFSRYMV